MSDFDRSLSFVLSEEGGYANVVGDRGGETYKGVARNFNPHWGGWVKIDLLKEKGIVSHAELDQLLGADVELQNEIAQLYRMNYWMPVRGDSLQLPINTVLFDGAVQHGPRTSIRLLQHAMTIKEDGAFGPITMTNVGRWTPVNLTDKIILARKQYYQDIVANDETQSRFLVGWMNRLEHLNKFISEAA